MLIISQVIEKPVYYQLNLLLADLIISINVILRGESRATATSKMECFVIIVCGTIITKRSILDIAAALDPPLILVQLMIA